MIELRVLGGLDLRRSDAQVVQSLLAQPKRMALLAYLALARPRGFHRRDTLLALFWPEFDAEHARASLRQSVHILRRSLGEKSVQSRGDEEVALGERVVWCDAVELETALDAGELERGLGLYAGELLPGFYIGGAPDFERWLDSERARLRERAAGAAWALAEVRERAGQLGSAVDWGRRALALAPADDALLGRFMELVARAGDRGAALAAYESHARLLRAEFEIEPSPAVQTLAQQLRRSSPVAAGPRSRAAAPAATAPAVAEPEVWAEPPVPVIAMGPPPPRVAGRERELAHMCGWLDRALAGELAVGLVAGEAGSGKTALVSEFARRASERDDEVAVLFGDCNSQTGIGDPYLPFREILAQLTGDIEGRRAQRQLMGANAARLRSLVRVSLAAVADSGPDLVGSLLPTRPLLARLRGLAARDPAIAQRLRELVIERTDTSALQQSHLLEQYTSVLRAVATYRPLLLVLEDLHWADEGSLGLLFHLTRRLGAARVAIVGTYRPEEVTLGREGTRHPLQPVLSELKRHFGEVWIELVSDTGAPGRELLDALVDLEPNHLGRPFRQALLERTGGHPLFTLELLADLRERGELARDDAEAWYEASPVDWTKLPARVEGVIEHRIGRLTAELRQLLTAASVEGEDFTAEVVARARELEERAVIERLSGELEKRHRLVAARELRRVGEHRISLYRFRHILFRNYLYSELDPVERAYLHETVAHALEALYGERRDDVAVQLARHWEEAGETARAALYRLKAGEQARAMFANLDAAGHFRRALELMGDAPADVPERRAQRLRAWEGLGDVLSLAGAAEEARAAYDAATRLLPPAERIARARLLRKTGNVFVRYWRYAEALAASQAAEAALGEGPEGCDEEQWTREWLDVLLDRGWILYSGADVAGLHELAERLRERVAERGSAEQRAHYFQILFLFDIRDDHYFMTPRTIEDGRAGVQACEATSDTFLLEEALFFLGFGLVWAGQLEEGEAVLRRGLAHAERGGDLHIQTQSRCYITLAHRFRQDVEAVRAEAERTLAVAEAANEPFYIGSARGHQAWVAWREGEIERAQQLAEAAMSCWHGAAWPFPWVGLWPLLGARHALGKLEGAIAAARGLIDLPMEPGGQPLKGAMPQPEALRLILQRAVEAWNAGDEKAADTALREAIDVARQSGRL